MKLWGGRFSKQTDSLVQQFNESLPFDVRLYDEDITASIVWARGLVRANVLSEQEAATIINGLEQIRSEFQQGAIEFNPSDEDVHTLVERRLTEIVGPVGGKLHTGRSRNDQVATDIRLYLRDEMQLIMAELKRLQVALLDLADRVHELGMIILYGYAEVDRKIVAAEHNSDGSEPPVVLQ